MPFLCTVDKDTKAAADISNATEKLRQEAKLEYKSFTTLSEFDQFIQSENKKDPAKPTDAEISLLVVSSDVIPNINKEALENLKEKYKAQHLVVSAFYDPLHPLKKIETWPVDNIIFKPFDQAILQEHLRFSSLQGKKITPTAVHSAKENFEIEKIRRYSFTALSEFGFKIISKSNFELNVAYKFYHFIFQDQKRLSLWAKPIYHQGDEYEFIFCCPTPAVITQLRKKSTESQTKLKNVIFNGWQKNKDLRKVKIGVELANPDEVTALKSFFSRRYPDVEVIDIVDDKTPPPAVIHLFISEKSFDSKYIQERFGADCLYFYITNEVFKSRKEAEDILHKQTARLAKPLDRHYLSRLLLSYFPSLRDSEPLPIQWFTVQEETLFSETVIAQEFSEAAFVYERETILAPGHYQEFALPHEDENELKPLKAKIQFADDKANATTKLFPHQVVFYGIRDDLLKKIRLWGLQTFIQKKNSG